MDLTTSKQSTVIVTTHYIEEAKMADNVMKSSTYMCELITVVYFYDQVGLMRGGVLLAQSSPTALMKAYSTTVSHQLATTHYSCSS